MFTKEYFNPINEDLNKQRFKINKDLNRYLS